MLHFGVNGSQPSEIHSGWKMKLGRWRKFRGARKCRGYNHGEDEASTVVHRGQRWLKGRSGRSSGTDRWGFVGILYLSDFGLSGFRKWRCLQSLAGSSDAEEPDLWSG